jgi:hypothetical protein
MSWLPDGGNLFKSLGLSQSYGTPAEEAKSQGPAEAHGSETAAAEEPATAGSNEHLAALDNVRSAWAQTQNATDRARAEQRRVGDREGGAQRGYVAEQSQNQARINNEVQARAVRMDLAAARAVGPHVGNQLNRLLGFVDAVKNMRGRDIPPGGIQVSRELLPPVGLRRFYMPWAAEHLNTRMFVTLRDPAHGDRAVYSPTMGGDPGEDPPSERELYKFYRLFIQPTLMSIDHAMRQRFAVYITPNRLAAEDHFSFQRCRERLMLLLYPSGTRESGYHGRQPVDMSEALYITARELMSYYQHDAYGSTVDNDRLTRSVLVAGGRDCAAEILLNRRIGVNSAAPTEMMRAVIARVGQDMFLRAFFSGDPAAERAVVAALRKIMQEYLATQRSIALDDELTELRIDARHRLIVSDELEVSAAMSSFDQHPQEQDNPQSGQLPIPEAIVSGGGHTVVTVLSVGGKSYRVLYSVHPQDGGHVLMATAPEVDPSILVSARVANLGPTDTVTVTNWQVGRLQNDAAVQLLTSLFRQYGVFPTHQLVLQGFASREIEGLWRRSRHPYESEIGERGRQAIIDLRFLPTDAFFVVRGPDKLNPIVDIVIGIDRNSVGPRLRMSALQHVNVGDPRCAELVAIDAAFRGRARGHLTADMLPAWQRALWVPGAEFERLYAVQPYALRPVQSVPGFITYDSLGHADTLVIRNDVRPTDVEKQFRLPRVNATYAVISFYLHPDFVARLREVAADPRYRGSNIADSLAGYLAWRMAGIRSSHGPEHATEYTAAYVELRKAAEHHPIDPAYFTWAGETFLGEQTWQALGDDLVYKACLEGDPSAIQTVVERAQHVVQAHQASLGEQFPTSVPSPTAAQGARSYQPVAQHVAPGPYGATPAERVQRRDAPTPAPENSGSPWSSPFRL